jgi:hypothetical protein
MVTSNRDLTDAELDNRLTRLYAQHYKADLKMRERWHLLIVDVLTEQKTRRDLALKL